MPGTGGGGRLALLLDGDTGVESSLRNLGDVGNRGDVGTGGAGAETGGSGGGARVTGGSSFRGVSKAPGPDSSSSVSEPSDLAAFAIGAGGGGGRAMLWLAGCHGRRVCCTYSPRVQGVAQDVHQELAGQHQRRWLGLHAGW